MRIAVITESFFPHVNGVSGSVAQVLRHLRRHGHDAIVLAPGNPPADFEGFPVVGLPSVPFPGYPQVRVSLASERTIADELERFGPDVVHLASPFVVGRPAVRAAQRLQVPVVAVYQTDVARFAERYSLGPASRMAWRRLRSIHGRADVTLAPSSTAVEDLRRHGVLRVALWPRGVDTAAFSPGYRDNDLRRDLAGPDDVLVGYVGRLAAEKQVDDLRVLDAVPGVRLVVIGDGPERAALRRALPRAAFLGLLTGAALSRAVASLDIAVQPGPYETFCQSAQEAMASGVPVIAVGEGATRELIDQGRTGEVYAAGDLAELRALVVTMSREPARRTAMGLAARAAVRHRTWPVVCDQLLSHYHGVVHAMPTPAESAG